VTSFGKGTRFKGGLTGEFEKIDLTLNVIVYGVGSGEIERLAAEGLREYVGEVAISC
jgi:hypothetical protein